MALPFLLVLMLKGGAFLFALFISVIGIVALGEYYRIVFTPTPNLIKDPVTAFGFLICPLMIWAAYVTSFESIILLITLNLLVSGCYSLRQFRSDVRAVERLFKQVFGILYIPLFLSFLVLIRNSSQGLVWIFFLLVMVFACDTGAFYIGTWLGRNKLCPSVSPNKTIEGSIGGLAAALIAGGIYRLYVIPDLALGKVMLLSIVIGIVGQIGDLFESECKRYGHIKDSGSILPGHGGLLDRIDALLFAAPVVYCFKQYLL